MQNDPYTKYFKVLDWMWCFYSSSISQQLLLKRKLFSWMIYCTTNFLRAAKTMINSRYLNMNWTAWYFLKYLVLLRDFFIYILEKMIIFFSHYDVPGLFAKWMEIMYTYKGKIYIHRNMICNNVFLVI